MPISSPTKPADVTKKSVELHIPPGNVCISILLGDDCCGGVDEGVDEGADEGVDEGVDDALSIYNIILSN